MMYWSRIILALALVALPSAYANNAETTTCGTESFQETVKNMRTLIYKWKLTEDSVFLSDLGKHLEKIPDKLQLLMKDCPEEKSQEYAGVMLFATGVIGREPTFAVNAVQLIQDEHLREDVLSLVCAVDCELVLNILSSLEETEYKMQMYQHLLNLMKNTQLNNTELVTSTDFIKQLNTLVSKENDTTLSEMLHRLLRQAIKTDMVLQHDNLEELYKANHDVTASVVDELVTRLSEQMIKQKISRSLKFSNAPQTRNCGFSI